MTLMEMDGPSNYFAQLFGMYLFIIVCITLVRTFRLTSSVYSFRRKKVSFVNKDNDFDAFARYVLRGNQSLDVLDSILQKSSEGVDGIENDSIRSKMNRIETRFAYLWEITD